MVRKSLVPTLFCALLALFSCARKEPPPEPQIYLREGPSHWEPPKALARLGAAPRINAAGIDIIKRHEALRLEAYHLAGQWLIGYGHSMTAKPGMTITEDEAERLLREDLLRIERELLSILPAAPFSENEWSAMVALAYNLGVGGFSRTQAFERLLAGDRPGAADAFLHLDTAVIDGERREIPSLRERRETERALFLTPDGPSEPAAPAAGAP